jgi:nucleoside-diphosphate-sugar epimerase
VNVAVTGSSGYVGGVIAAALRDAGHRVHEIGRRKPAALRKGERFITHTLGEPLDPKALRGVDALVHCAYDWGPHSREEIWRVNVEGTRLLLDAARTAHARFILVSSVAAYPQTRSLYGKAKLEEEALGPDAIVRPALVYGKRAGGMVGALRLAVRRSPLVPLFSGQPFWMCHEQDLGALLAAIVGEKRTGLFVASALRRVPLRELVRALARVEGRRPLLVPVPNAPVLLALRAAEALGIRPRLRSDSLIGMMHQASELPGPRGGVRFREFSEKALRE